MFFSMFNALLCSSMQLFYYMVEHFWPVA